MLYEPPPGAIWSLRFFSLFRKKMEGGGGGTLYEISVLIWMTDWKRMNKGILTKVRYIFIPSPSTFEKKNLLPFPDNWISIWEEYPPLAPLEKKGGIRNIFYRKVCMLLLTLFNESKSQPSLLKVEGFFLHFPSLTGNIFSFCFIPTFYFYSKNVGKELSL